MIIEYVYQNNFYLHNFFKEYEWNDWIRLWDIKNFQKIEKCKQLFKEFYIKKINFNKF